MSGISKLLLTGFFGDETGEVHLGRVHVGRCLSNTNSVHTINSVALHIGFLYNRAINPSPKISVIFPVREISETDKIGDRVTLSLKFCKTHLKYRMCRFIVTEALYGDSGFARIITRLSRSLGRHTGRNDRQDRWPTPRQRKDCEPVLTDSRDSLPHGRDGGDRDERDFRGKNS